MTRLLIPVVFFVLLISAGAALLAIVVDDSRKASQSATWPVVRGTIMADGVEGAIALRGATYTYVADGILHKRTRTRFLAGNRWLIRAPARTFSEGQGITVYTHPANGLFSVLFTEYNPFVFLILLIPSILMIFIGGGGVWYVLSQQGRAR